MIDRHIMQQMDNVLSMREGKGMRTNEQALFAFIQFGKDADVLGVLACAEYFLPEPVDYGSYGPSCWINPKGGFYTVEYGGHSSFAYKLGIADHLLNRAGWIHASDGRADDYYGRWTPAQRKVVERYNLTPHDCSAWARSRLADEAKEANLRGLEFRHRDGWDWRTDVTVADFPDKDDFRRIDQLVRENTIAY